MSIYAPKKLTNTHSVYYNAQGHSEKGGEVMEAIAQARLAKQQDKRKKKTKGAIRSALLRLLSQKDASQIRVSELTETADISRKTFYLHYSGVDEAITELENEIEQKVVAAVRESNLWEYRHNLYIVFSRVDKVLKEDGDYSCYLKNRYSRFFMMYKLKDAIKRTVLEQAKENIAADESELDAVTDFAVSGVLSMYYEWLKAQQETLQQLAEKGTRILYGVYSALKGKKTEEKEEKEQPIQDGKV